VGRGKAGVGRQTGACVRDGMDGAYFSTPAQTDTTDYIDTRQMLAYSTQQLRTSGLGQGQAHQFSLPQHRPTGQAPRSSSNTSAAQQWQTSVGGFSQAQTQSKPFSQGPYAPSNGQVAQTDYTPVVFQPAAQQQQHVAQRVSSSTQPLFQGCTQSPFQGWSLTPQVVQAPICQPQPAVPTSGVVALGRPRAALHPKLAAALSPVLSLNCRQGHGLVCISGKPARYSDWGCDLCHQRIPHDTKFVMHCDKCASDGPVAAGVASGFDICPSCRAKSRDAISVWPLFQNAAGCPMFPGVGDYWQTLYCHRQQAPCQPAPSNFYSFCGGPPPPARAPCGPREGAQCLDCKRGQDALVASVEGRLLNRGGRAVSHVCFGVSAGMYFCSECSGGQVQCADCKFTQENLPEIL
jgi:hypothetical protein